MEIHLFLPSNLPESIAFCVDFPSKNYYEVVR